MVDYSRDDRVVGIEFICASAGVDLSELGALAGDVENAILSAGLSLRVYV